jgi:hypothetical protein
MAADKKTVDFSVEWMTQEMRKGDLIELKCTLLPGLVVDEKVVLKAISVTDGVYVFDVMWLGIQLASVAAVVDFETRELIWTVVHEGLDEPKHGWPYRPEKVSVVTSKEEVGMRSVMYSLADMMAADIGYDEHGLVTEIGVTAELVLPLKIPLTIKPKVLASSFFVEEHASASRVPMFSILLSGIVQVLGNLGLAYAVAGDGQMATGSCTDKKVHVSLVDLSKVTEGSWEDFVESTTLDTAMGSVWEGVEKELVYSSEYRQWNNSQWTS